MRRDAQIKITMRKCHLSIRFRFDTFALFKLVILNLLLINFFEKDSKLVEGKLVTDLKLSTANLKVVYAVNAGGLQHTDIHGITYEADPLTKIGTASDYGNNLLIIGRVIEQDEVLYRTERYHTATFGYDIVLEGEGDYALILKFCEVYFNEAEKKVFDVVLNKQHKIVNQLDIFLEVGHGTAHEEYAFFAVINGRLYYNSEISEIRNNVIRLDFVKGEHDNPKINAFAFLKGEVQHIPRLKGLPSLIDPNDGLIAADALPMQGFQRKHSTPPGYNQKKLNQMVAKQQMKIEKDEIIRGVAPHDPENDIYEDVDFMDEEELNEMNFYGRNPNGLGLSHPNARVDESVVFLPLFICMAAFIPMLYCLCKL